MDLVQIDGRYRQQQKAWSGSFSKSDATMPTLSRLTCDYTGEIYFAHDILTGQDVAIKLKPIDGRNHTLEHEFHVYNKLNKGTGIPCVCWFGTEASFNVMVIDRLGLSLEDIFVCCHFRFTVKIVALLACQLVCAIICYVTTCGLMSMFRSAVCSLSTLATLFTMISNLAISSWVWASTPT